MGKNEHANEYANERETGRKGALVCPACKGNVDTVIKRRHKTLGVFVPVWEQGPCRNPDCSAYADYPKHTPRHQDH